MEYRLADCSDVDGIYAVETRCFKTPWLYDSLKDDICGNGYSVYLTAVDDGTIVGFCGVHIVLDECHINNLAVLDEYRRQGIASRLLQLLFESTGHMTKYYWLEVRQFNAAAQKLYEGFGFMPVAVRPEYYADTNEDALVMLKTVKKQAE